MNRPYNHLYMCGPFCVQILLNSNQDGVTIHLLPQISIAFKNRYVCFALGFEWIQGTVNIGVMSKEQRNREIERVKQVQANAVKAGLTQRQQELRWGW